MLRLAAHGALLAAGYLSSVFPLRYELGGVFPFFPLSGLIRKDKGLLKSTNEFAVEMSLDLATQLHSYVRPMTCIPLVGPLLRHPPHFLPPPHTLSPNASCEQATPSRYRL